MGIKRVTIKIYDMTCTSCEERIGRALRNLEGVTFTKASYSKSAADIEFDDKICSRSKIEDTIKKAGYSTSKPNKSGDRILGIVFVVIAMVVLSSISLNYDLSEKLSNATYPVLIIVGIISSLHCVGMCGGIMLSQSINVEGSRNKLESIFPAVLYNFGRVVSYTLLGGLIGALGSVISLSTISRAALQIAAGLFMIIMGLNMIGLSWFRVVHIKLPWSACKIKQKSKMPFVVGLLNGLMPCGPLQTMQLFALGTGSVAKGAASMFFFSIGTVPLMLTFGAISGLLSSGSTKKILKFSGILVISLGIVMGGRGLNIMGVTLPSLDFISNNFSDEDTEDLGKDRAKAEIQENVQVVSIKVNAQDYNPATIVVQKNIPVKLVIIGEQITSCNNTIVISAYKIQHQLQKGENIIEFTPTTAGDVKFSCSMGMLSGTIKVVDNLQTASGNEAADSNASYLEDRGESIYGNNLSIVPANILVKKADISGNVQRVKIEGFSYEFKPLVVILNKDVKARMTLDLRYFESPNSEFNIVEEKSGKIIKSFKGKKDIIELEVPTNELKAYGIFKGNRLLAVIEVVSDLKNTDLDNMKKKYIQ